MVKISLLGLLAVLALTQLTSAASNCIVNLSHYDEGAPDFAHMRRDGVMGVIHEATYPPFDTDPKYAARQKAAVREGLWWGAYHFGNGHDPVRQADHFVDFVARQSRQGPGNAVLMVLDFETNTHYPGGTMTVAQAVRFVKRVKERTGKYPGLYSNENRVRKFLSTPTLETETKRTLAQTWLWVANYHWRPGTFAPWGNWTMWQYTGDGICDLPRLVYPIHVANMRNVERNLFQGTKSEAVAFWKAHAWKP
jgi:lysozyme